MPSGPPKRKRGVVLTPTGRQQLQSAITAWEEQDNFGAKLTIEDLSDLIKLDAGTVAKVLDGEEGVDRRTLERFFQALNLTLTPVDYGQPIAPDHARPTRETRIDWGEAVDVAIFYGRTAELATLEQWIVADQCRLVAVLGMGGIGKTSLAAKLGEQVQAEFDYVVWRSLREGPPLKEILTSLIQFLSNQQETTADLPESLGGWITKLLEYLRTHRCLLILDNAESILQEGQAGVYREGYEGYGELLKRVGEAAHQSCLVVTSREKPRELSAMEGEALRVRSMSLRWVEGADGQEILTAKELQRDEVHDQGNELVDHCAGNLSRGAANSMNPLAADQLLTLDAFKAAIATYHERQLALPPAIAAIADALESHVNHLDRLSETDDTFELVYQTTRLALQTQSSQRAKLLYPTAAAEVANPSPSAQGEIPAISTTGNGHTPATPHHNAATHPTSPPIKRFVLPQGHTHAEQQAFGQYIQTLKQLNPQWIVSPDTCDTGEAESYIMLYNDERYPINHAAYIASQLISRFFSLSQ